jgi:hypothetical protein
MTTVSEVLTALAGGAIGSVLTAGFGQAARARVAWSEVDLHDQDAAERNAQLLAWVDDRTLQLAREMYQITEEFSGRGAFHSSLHANALVGAKAQALHEFRDEEWRARIALANIRAAEGFWHHLWRLARRHPAATLTASADAEPFLNRWREPVARHGDPPATPVDRTRRTMEQARADLDRLSLT